MKTSWKIGGIIGLVAIVAMAAIGMSYAANGDPNPADNSLCTFVWVESNDSGSTANMGGYNPIDPGDNGNDPKQAQTPGVVCGRFGGNVATTNGSINQTSDTISVSIGNAYPGYYPTVLFGVSNQRTTPGIVESISIQNPNPALITVDLKGIGLNQTIDSGKEAVGALSIGVGDIPKNHTDNYTFKVTIVVTQLTAEVPQWPVSSQTFKIDTSSLPNGEVGVAYGQTLTASHGNTPYTWSITSGALPNGLTLNASTGAIIGNPSTAGTFNFSVQVTDITGSIDSANLSIKINATPLPTPTPGPGVTSTPTPGPGVTSTPTPGPGVTSTPTPTPKPTPTPTPGAGVPAIPWWSIGAIIGALLVAGLLFFLLWRRRKSGKTEETP